MQLSSAAVKQGDKVQLSGLTQELRLMKRTSTVTTASHAIRASVPTVPRFRPVHEEVSPPPPKCSACLLLLQTVLSQANSI